MGVAGNEAELNEESASVLLSPHSLDCRSVTVPHSRTRVSTVQACVVVCRETEDGTYSRTGQFSASSPDPWTVNFLGHLLSVDTSAAHGARAAVVQTQLCPPENPQDWPIKYL